MTRIDWKALEEFERNNVETICQQFFPLGKKVGHEWKIGDMTGAAGDSLGIQLAGEKAGLWHDRATGESGKLRNLIAVNRGISDQAAVEEIERAFGVRFRENGDHEKNGGLMETWEKARAMARKNIASLAEQRGFSPAFCEYIIDVGLIGMQGGKWCFPSYSENGKLVSLQIRVNAGQWYYEPNGQTVTPLTAGDIKTARTLHACESNFDMLATMEKLGFPRRDRVAFLSTRGAGNSKLVAQYAPPSSLIYAWTQNDKEGKKWLQKIVSATSLVRAVQVPESFKDVNDWTRDGNATSDQIQCAIDNAQSDNRKVILHPVSDRYISEFARELGGILKQDSFYRFHGSAVQVRDVTVKARNGKEYQVKKLVDLTPTLFSTIIETYCRPVVEAMVNKKKIQIKKSISMEISARTLVCLDFVNELPEIKLWTDARLPVRNGDQITLTNPGYDPESGVYTSPLAPEIDETLTVQTAAREWRELLREFCFPKSGISDKDQPNEKVREPEKERCISVALAAALTPLCLYLLPEKAKRPAFAASANAEGAGKTLLLSFGMVAKLGFVPTGTAPDKEEEMRKVLDSAAHYAVPILFFDNLKGHLSSGELEAFITSSTRQYRQLRTTNYTEADNISTVYITANFATYSPDMRRRLLAVELFLEESRAEERTITNFLDEDALINMRPRLISILWAFIKSWHTNGQIPSSNLLPSFEHWSKVVGGIVQNAGFSSPCELAELKTGGDTDTQDMQKLVSEMPYLVEFRFNQLIEICQDHHLFQRLVPTDFDMEKSQSTRMGLIFRKFVGRVFNVQELDGKNIALIKQYRFCLTDGTRKTERYYVRDVLTEH